MKGGAPLLTAAQMREADARTIAGGVPGLRLMRRAGAAVARAALEAMPDAGRIVVVAGAGNNGGDGFAAAAQLARRGLPVTALMLKPQAALTGDAAACAAEAADSGVKLREVREGDLAFVDGWLARAMLVVDAMLGIGARPVEGWWAEVIGRVNACDRKVLAVDVPSGLDADRGVAEGAVVRADVTLPIAAWKWGHWLNEGPDCCGRLLPPAAIGIAGECMAAAMRARPAPVAGAALLDDAALAGMLPPRPRRAHKGMFGHVWVLGGSQGFTGAPQLAARGALAAGAGLASIACPAEVWPVVAAATLEIMAHPDDAADGWKQADALVAGPGWGRSRAGLLDALLDVGAPLVLDADALNMLAADAGLQRKLSARGGVTVLTPHPGEAARLLGCAAADVERDRVAAALELARRFHAFVALKGVPTLLVDAACDRMLLSPLGSPALATAGSGDVLAGAIGGMLARRGDLRLPVMQALALAAGLHGRAGETPGLWRAGQLPERIARLRIALESGEGLC